ncbi:CpsB/CapC family capsule biosynthesis tyrosine phosphatase [Metabacillus idriensis]|uniref:tyrosine-protein phosphatase n=1 Tax=Metabacillus idriensis TaxID=324768 RepID=UPI002813994B|nr:CpsB/CapC family capsule biosynthesis tyrosine phosphatase [Metabacillus idriensis]MDR0138865.1 CpsB/CapC family capsule biosynthesis tyrosine phosphatase [Metabacillus idriensis]
MIDIHCHILPGVDDGAADLNESLEMAKAAYNEGIKTIIATPHHQNGRYENNKATVNKGIEVLRDALDQANIPLTILPGQEVRMYGEILQDYDSNLILPLNQANYILIEFPSNHVPRYAEQMLFDLQMKGLTPIIAHPERNAEIIEHPAILYNLIKKGACSQITAASLTGEFGKKIKKFSHQLIEANLTHFIASDAHNTSNRSFKWSQAMNVLKKEYGRGSQYYFLENAELLLNGQSIYKESPERIQRKKILGLF